MAFVEIPDLFGGNATHGGQFAHAEGSSQYAERSAPEVGSGHMVTFSFRPHHRYIAFRGGPKREHP